MGIPFAYEHFGRGRIASPTDTKDLAVEQKVEAVLDEHGLFYAKSETWIDSEKLYEVEIEVQEKEQLKHGCSFCVILQI